MHVKSAQIIEKHDEKRTKLCAAFGNLYLYIMLNRKGCHGVNSDMVLTVSRLCQFFVFNLPSGSE